MSWLPSSAPKQRPSAKGVGAVPRDAVVMAAKGYPGTPEKGGAIHLPDSQDAMVFHAGTAMHAGQLVANGGRVLNVTAQGKTVTEAQTRAYAAVEAIDFPTGFCRRDIGWREVAREKGA